METKECTCNKANEEEFCPLCCPEMYECVEWPHVQAYFAEKYAKGKGLTEEGEEFSGRIYYSLRRAWHWTCKELAPESDKEFTIENLCKNYDTIANKSGVGQKALAKLKEIALRHGVEVVSKYQERADHGPYIIPIK